MPSFSTARTAAALAALVLSSALPVALAAEPRVMVSGDSISAGDRGASYRKPLLDELAGYGCAVEMVGDQTLNGFDYRNPITRPGAHLGGFTPGLGYDTDHQAFPAVTTEEYANGVTAVATVRPVAAYVSAEQPDYVLLHLGTNDLNRSLRAGNTSNAQIEAWASQTTSEINLVVNRIIGAHQNPSRLRILLANFIPYAADFDSGAQTAAGPRASAVFTRKLENLIETRADPRLLIVDVATGFDSASMTYDGVHPNVVGEQHMAGAFLPVLRGAGLCPDTPEVTSPRVGGTVEGGSTTIRWNADGVSADAWRVYVGRSQSGSSATYGGSRVLGGGARGFTVSGLPEDGSNVFVALQYRVDGVWDLVLSSFISKASGGGGEGGGGGGTGNAPIFTDPVPGSTLGGASQTFSWVPGSVSARQWWVRAGSTANGRDYFDSGRLTSAGTRSVRVDGLPLDGSTVHLELNYKLPSGAWETRNYSYRAASGSGTGGGGTDGGSTDGSGTGGGGSAGGGTSGGGDGSTSGGPSGSGTPRILSPAPGGTLGGRSQVLSWSTNGTTVQQWWVRAGSSPGGRNYFDSGRITDASRRSVTVTGLPNDASTVYIEFSHKLASGAWVIENFSYTASGGGGSDGDGTSDSGTGDSGTSDSGTGGGSGGDTSDGGSGGGGSPELISPRPGNVLRGPSANLTWRANGTTVRQWWVRAGRTPGGSEYFDSGRITNPSASGITVSGLPSDGSVIYIEFSYKIPSGAWIIDVIPFNAGT